MELTFDNELYNVTVENVNGMFCIVVNGEKFELPGKAINGNTFSLTLDDRSINVYAAEDDDAFYVNVEGRSFTFKKVKEETGD